MKSESEARKKKPSPRALEPEPGFYSKAAAARWRREAAAERARLFGPEAETEEERARRGRYEREAQASAERARRSYRAKKQLGLPGAGANHGKRRDIRKGARALPRPARDKARAAGGAERMLGVI